MWNLVPWPGIQLWPPALEEQSLSHWTTMEVPQKWTLIIKFLCRSLQFHVKTWSCMLETGLLLYTSGKYLLIIKTTSQVLPPNMQNCNVKWGNHASPNCASRKLWNTRYCLRLCGWFLSWWGRIPYLLSFHKVLWSPAMPSWDCKQYCHPACRGVSKPNLTNMGTCRSFTLPPGSQELTFWPQEDESSVENVQTFSNR